MLLGPAPAQEGPGAGRAGGLCRAVLQPCTHPSGGLQRASLRAGLQLPAAAAELATIVRGSEGMSTPAWASSLGLPSRDGTGCDPIPPQREEQRGSQAANATAQVVLSVSSALLGSDTTQDNWKTPPRQPKQQRHSKSGPFPSLPCPPGALPPPKKGKDAKKMRLEYEYDVQTAAAAVTQLELCRHKGPSRSAGSRDEGQPQPSLHPQPPPAAHWRGSAHRALSPACTRSLAVATALGSPWTTEDAGRARPSRCRRRGSSPRVVMPGSSPGCGVWFGLIHGETRRA